jgi:hypothetical protein
MLTSINLLNYIPIPIVQDIPKVVTTQEMRLIPLLNKFNLIFNILLYLEEESIKLFLSNKKFINTL